MDLLELELICACAVASPAVSVAHTAHTEHSMVFALAGAGVLALLAVGNVIVPRWSCLGLHTTACVIASRVPIH